LTLHQRQSFPPKQLPLFVSDLYGNLTRLPERKMSKDVMMARRVGGSMDSVDAAHYSSGGASAQQSSYQPPPISNYKGVMLCDRPVNKAAGSKMPQATASGQQMPFNCRFV
jgi:hypothetical protein